MKTALPITFTDHTGKSRLCPKLCPFLPFHTTVSFGWEAFINLFVQLLFFLIGEIPKYLNRSFPIALDQSQPQSFSPKSVPCIEEGVEGRSVTFRGQRE